MANDKQKAIESRLFRAKARIGSEILAGRLDPYVIAEVLEKAARQRIFRIPPTDGQRTVDGASFLDLDGGHEPSVLGEATTTTQVQVMYLPPSSTFGDAFRELGDLDKMVLQESQAVAFLEKWPAFLDDTEDALCFLTRHGGAKRVVVACGNGNSTRTDYYAFFHELGDRIGNIKNDPNDQIMAVVQLGRRRE